MPITIESADDPRVAEFVGLRDRPMADGFFIAETELVVSRLLTSPFQVRSFLLTPKGYGKLRDQVTAVAAPVYVAERVVMQQIVGFDLHRGVLASVQRHPLPSLADVLATATRLLVIEGSNDLVNLGTVVRSARGLGFDALVLDPRCADPFARRSVRVSMGEIFHLPIVRTTTWPQPLAAIAEAGFETWALTPDLTATDLFVMPRPAKLALLAGAEGPGLTAASRGAAHHQVRIPMHHGVDSLNLGHAIAIAMAATSPPVSGAESSHPPIWG
ncbi:MAG: RNA methyltransferase [Actinomycetota bacterium]|nr:RNA methyltransferase [Actinomycetota bacterium]